jgi:hypothetical protein
MDENTKFSAACPRVTKEEFYRAVKLTGMKIQAALAESLEMWVAVRTNRATFRKKPVPKEAA